MGGTKPSGITNNLHFLLFAGRIPGDSLSGGKISKRFEFVVFVDTWKCNNSGICYVRIGFEVRFVTVYDTRVFNFEKNNENNHLEFVIFVGM